MNKIKKFITEHKTAIIIVVVVMIIAAIAAGVYATREKKEESTAPTYAPQKYVKNPNWWENVPKVEAGQSKEIVRYVERAQAGTMQPTAHFTIQAATPEQAAQEAKNRIAENDPTLPAAALEKTDKTVVTTQSENKDHDVGVYKINLRKDHKIKAGAMAVDGSAYWAAGYQCKRLEYTVYGQGKDVKGGSVMYTVAEW